MSDFFPPDDFEGYDYPDEFSSGEFNIDDYWLMSMDEFLEKQIEPPDDSDNPDEIPVMPDEWFDYELVLSADDEIHGDIFDEDTVTVLNLRDVDPLQMRRHVFADVQDAIDWLQSTGLFLIGSLVDLGGGFYGVAIHNTGKSSAG
jgi:hypothetical protein